MINFEPGDIVIGVGFWPGRSKALSFYFDSAPGQAGMARRDVDDGELFTVTSSSPRGASHDYIVVCDTNHQCGDVHINSIKKLHE